jgi:polyhydroxyalkanoate synthase
VRWALDEVPLPGKLVHQIIDWLYRENRFCREKLKIHEKLVGPHGLSTPTLVVINTADQIASLASLISFTEKRLQRRRSYNIPAKWEYVCNISEFWLAAKRKLIGRTFYSG